jgi:hypothetical protein
MARKELQKLPPAQVGKQTTLVYCFAILPGAVSNPALRLSLSRKLSPLILTRVDWCRMRSSIAAVSTLSLAKALSQLQQTLDLDELALPGLPSRASSR